MVGLSDPIDYGVVGLPLLPSIWSVAVALERFAFYHRLDVAEFDSAEMLEMHLTRRLTVIGTIAANAPYIVGLLGTVLGIMLTFYTMGSSGAMGVKPIMVGLGLALKSIAMDLLVAIPCVALNNGLRSRVKELLTEFGARRGG